MKAIQFGPITSICVVTQMGTNRYAVGETLQDERGQKRTIAQIIDQSKEYPDGIAFLYWVVDENGDGIASIENCPCEVMYAKKE